MEKLTDQELDALFKSAAEGINPEYEVAEWEGMNERLNAVAKSPSIFNKWILLSLIGVIIFSGGIWIGYTLSNSASEPDAKNNEKILTESKIVSDQRVSEKRFSPQANASANDAKKISNLESRNSTTDQIQKTTLVEKKRYVDDEVSEKKDVENELLEADQEVKIIDLHESNLVNVYNLQQDTQVGKDLFLNESNIDSIASSEVIVKQESDSTDVISDKNKDNQAQKKSLFIRGLASPDFTSINFGSSGAAGSNYALLIEYQFANRWWVSTGAIRSFKKYSSNGEITYSGRSADNLDGACRILDIPLNVYYQIKPFSKTSFFGSVGLSSYVMLSEDYKYTIYTNSGDRVYSKLVEKENNEWFKVLNLSVGIQRQLNSRFYLQAEPFLKAPLAGVGYGDVRLSSLGVFFGVKYKLN
jgi:hypothetical protein